MTTRRNATLALALFGLLITTALPALAQENKRELLAGVPSTPTAKAQQALDRNFYDYQVLEFDLPAVAQQARRTNGVRLHLGNRILELELELNDLRAPGYKAVVMTEDGPVEQQIEIATYRGQIKGDPSSIVRLSAYDDMLLGYVKTEFDWLFIDPLRDYNRQARPGEVVVYREADVRPDATKACGAEHYESFAGELGLPPLQGAIMTKAPRRFDVATDADGQYYSSYGNPGSFNRMSSVLNNVDGIYRSQLNLTVNIVYQQAWPNAGTDPYTSLNATTTLNQLRSWWNANNGSINRDVTHQFSGKSFSGSTVGIAWVGVVCNAPSYAYGLSEDQSSSFLNTQLTAHEIGHNFSAQHDNQSPVCPGVSCGSTGPIMCSFLQSSGSNNFSSCSQSSIASHTATYSGCLN